MPKIFHFYILRVKSSFSFERSFDHIWSIWRRQLKTVQYLLLIQHKSPLDENQDTGLISEIIHKFLLSSLLASQ